MGIITKDATGTTLKLKEEDKMMIKNQFSKVLKEMDDKKNKIIAYSINYALKQLKEIIEKIENQGNCTNISLDEMKLGLKMSRAIVQKAVEEYSFCGDEKEKPLYLM